MLIGAVEAECPLEGLVQSGMLPGREEAEVRARWRDLLFDESEAERALKRLRENPPSVKGGAKGEAETDRRRERLEATVESAARLEPAALGAEGREGARKGAMCIVRGNRRRWRISKPVAVIGRKPADGAPVDVDLSNEGDAAKVSRQQAVLEQRPDGLVYLRNHGRRPLHVDGEALPPGGKAALQGTCLLEVGGIPLLVIPCALPHATPST